MNVVACLKLRVQEGTTCLLQHLIYFNCVMCLQLLIKCIHTLTCAVALSCVSGGTLGHVAFRTAVCCAPFTLLAVGASFTKTFTSVNITIEMLCDVRRHTVQMIIRVISLFITNCYIDLSLQWNAIKWVQYFHLEHETEYMKHAKKNRQD